MVPVRLCRFVRLGVCLVLAGLLLRVLLALLLDWALPFLAGFALAALLEPAVRFLTRRLRLPRWAAAGLCTLLLALAAAGGLALLLWRLWAGLSPLLRDLPGLLAPLAAAGDRLSLWTRRLLVAAPPELRPALQTGVDALSQQAAALPAHLSAAAGGWLRAQGLLALSTFSLLALGLLLLGVPAPLLPAAATALTDALPVLGAGLVLAPWAVVALLAGDLPLGLGLLGLWGLAAAVRSLLEPRLVGRQAGLSPLAALAAMYVGFRALGVAGMILAPLGLTLAKALHDAGLLTLWRD